MFWIVPGTYVLTHVPKAVVCACLYDMSYCCLTYKRFSRAARGQHTIGAEHNLQQDMFSPPQFHCVAAGAQPLFKPTSREAAGSASIAKTRSQSCITYETQYSCSIVCCLSVPGCQKACCTHFRWGAPHFGASFLQVLALVCIPVNWIMKKPWSSCSVVNPHMVTESSWKRK